MAMAVPGGLEWIVIFLGIGGLVLRLAFMVFVIVFLFKIYGAITALQKKIEQLENK